MIVIQTENKIILVTLFVPNYEKTSNFIIIRVLSEKSNSMMIITENIII